MIFYWKHVISMIHLNILRKVDVLHGTFVCFTILVDKNKHPYRSCEAKSIKTNGFLKVRSRILDRGAILRGRVPPPEGIHGAAAWRTFWPKSVKNTCVFTSFLKPWKYPPPNLFFWKCFFLKKHFLRLQDESCSRMISHARGPKARRILIWFRCSAHPAGPQVQVFGR